MALIGVLVVSGINGRQTGRVPVGRLVAITSSVITFGGCLLVTHLMTLLNQESSQAGIWGIGVAVSVIVAGVSYRQNRQL